MLAQAGAGSIRQTVTKVTGDAALLECVSQFSDNFSVHYDAVVGGAGARSKRSFASISFLLSKGLVRFFQNFTHLRLRTLYFVTVDRPKIIIPTKRVLKFKLCAQETRMRKRECTSAGSGLVSILTVLSSQECSTQHFAVPTA